MTLSTYGFDIFGMCESVLSDSISNEEISIAGFSLISLGQTKLLTLETGVFAYILRNPYL